jgi:hypothetical protein
LIGINSPILKTNKLTQIGVTGRERGTTILQSAN